MGPTRIPSLRYVHLLWHLSSVGYSVHTGHLRVDTSRGGVHMALGVYRRIHVGVAGDAGACDTMELWHLVLFWAPHAAPILRYVHIFAQLIAVEPADHTIDPRIVRKSTLLGSLSRVFIWPSVCVVSFSFYSRACTPVVRPANS